MNAFGRPQSGHLLYFLTANFGVLFAFAMRDFLAKPTSDSINSIVLLIKQLHYSDSNALNNKAFWLKKIIL